MIRIDGSHGEGGGQIIRTALGFSCLLQQPVEIFNIRKGRKQPGLKNQHLSVVNSLASLCNAEVEGNFINSERIVFKPKEFEHKKMKINIGTAGSVTLLLQSLLLSLLKTKKELEIEVMGGTEVKWSPTIDYFQNVIMRFFEFIGYGVKLEVIHRGYYPEGGGFVRIKIKPVKSLHNFKLVEQEEINKVRGVSVVTGLDEKIALRQAVSASKTLFEKELEASIEKKLFEKNRSVGTSITLWTDSNFIGADALGEKGKPAEEVGREAALKLLEGVKAGAVVDKHLADNIIPYMAWITAHDKKENSFKTSEITNHCLSNIWVAEKFLPVKFVIDKEKSIVHSKCL